MQNHLKNKKVNVVLLCGGKGERLYPLTNDIPKPLLEIKNQPIISHIIKHLEKYNMTDLIIVSGYKSDKMENYVNKAYHAQNFRIIDSGDVDIISRIQDSLPFIEGDFMVLYGDTISNIDIDSLQKYHHLSDLPVTMAVWPLVSQFGVVEIDNNGTVIEFKEKPRLDKWINIGYFYFDSSMREMINESSSFAELLNRMSDERILGAYKHEGIHITVNTFKELTEAEKNINKI